MPSWILPPNDEAIGGYYAYRPGPRWVWETWGARFLGGAALLGNAIAEAIAQAVMARGPLSCGEASLSYHVRDRGVPRFAGDGAADIRRRAAQAHTLSEQSGTFAGLELALAAYGYTAAVSRYGARGEEGYGATDYQVVVRGAGIRPGWGRIGQAGVAWGDGRRVPGYAHIDTQVRVVCERYQAATARLARITAVIAGATVGQAGLGVGATGASWGGEALVWDYR